MKNSKEVTTKATPKTKKVTAKVSPKKTAKTVAVAETVELDKDVKEALKDVPTTVNENPLSKENLTATLANLNAILPKKVGGNLGKTYAKTGKRIYAFKIGDTVLKENDLVKIDVKGEKTVGKFRFVNVNVHSPKGYAVVLVNVNGKNKVYERAIFTGRDKDGNFLTPTNRTDRPTVFLATEK